MKLFFVVVLSLMFVLLSNTTQASPYDSGIIQWTQPNDVMFTARLWGDEFFHWMETTDGYRIVRGSAEWYYYAQLDTNGEFSPTDARVAIDTPPPGSYKLERSAARIAAINGQIAQFKERVRQNAESFAQLQEEAMNVGLPVTLRVAVILVEFADSAARHFRDPAHPRRPFGYLKADFDSMLFSSSGFWFDTSGTTPHPENGRVFGSMRDYYWQMSRPNGAPGALIVRGNVINPADINGVPIWIRLDSTRQYYENLSPPGPQIFCGEVLRKADSLGYLNGTYDRFEVIYAQESRFGTTLHPRAVAVEFPVGSGSYWDGFFNSERLFNVPPPTNPYNRFTHIGPHAHEFGHVIGLWDTYTDPALSLQDYDLMGTGVYNGPGVDMTSCPASLAPFHRLEKRWVTPILLSFDTQNLTIPYSYTNPLYYRINPVDRKPFPAEYFILETRGRQGFDEYLPNAPENFAIQPGVLLVWRHDFHYPVQLIRADNSLVNYLTDFFPRDPSTNYQSFNATTSPAPLMVNGSDARFALNGIRRIGNTTRIDTIAVRRATVFTPVIDAWHMLSVPLTLFNYVKTAVWPTPPAASAAFAYVCGQGYQQRDTLKNGPGYFIKFGLTDTLILAGGIREIDTAVVCANWNIVGSITDTIDTANVCVYPSGNKVLSPFYKYNSVTGYVPSPTIDPGLGYWVKVQSAGEMVFRKDASSGCGSGAGFAMSEFDHFEVTDAQGKKQDVYVANLDRDPSLAMIDLSMPPPFPEADFDARFEAGEFVRTVSPDSGVVELVINVEAQAYPVTVAWNLNPENGIEYSIITEGMGKQSGSPSLARSGSATMTRSSRGKFRFNAEVTGRGAEDVLPKAFLLAQNYPNPFNPETRIHFELPQDNSVRLVVYDLLGREVATLVNEFKKAGRYDALFNGRDLASGVYFYRLQAGTFNDVKKLLLLR